MKVIESNSKGQPTGWQHDNNKAFLIKFGGGQYYHVERPFKTNASGTEEVPVVETVYKFKEMKKLLLSTGG